jgi:catechol 2,3-dioxygenase-like lactoylglutathione lyase family enzyme
MARTTPPRGRVRWSEAEIEAHDRKPGPRLAAFGHISLPVADLDEAIAFYTGVLGGRLILDTQDFAEVVLAGAIVGLGAASGSAPAPDAEFPHLAFRIEPDQLVPMKEQLERHGVPTHDIWTRRGEEGLMYFKDPSGNLLELYCTAFPAARDLPRATSTSLVDLPALNYRWDARPLPAPTDR